MNIADYTIKALEKSHMTSEIFFLKFLIVTSLLIFVIMVVGLIISTWSR